LARVALIPINDRPVAIITIIFIIHLVPPLFPHCHSPGVRDLGAPHLVVPLGVQRLEDRKLFYTYVCVGGVQSIEYNICRMDGWMVPIVMIVRACFCSASSSSRLCIFDCLQCSCLRAAVDAGAEQRGERALVQPGDAL
jgi:hypothetical protein